MQPAVSKKKKNFDLFEIHKIVLDQSTPAISTKWEQSREFYVLVGDVLFHPQIELRPRAPVFVAHL